MFNDQCPMSNDQCPMERPSPMSNVQCPMSKDPLVIGYWSLVIGRSSADPGQLISRQLVHDAAAADGGAHLDEAARPVGDGADACGGGSQRVLVQGAQRGVRVL